MGALLSPPVGAVEGAETTGLTMDLRELVRASDLIVRGRVVRITQGTHDTDVKVEALEVFKGDPGIVYAQIKHRGGKFLVDPDEPYFIGYESVILFLKGEGDFYRCVFGKDGKKTIRNDNVYVQADNNFLTEKLKKYTQELSRLIEAEKNSGILGHNT